MPIYEYVCQQCGEVSEFLTKVGGEEAEIKCRACGSEEMAQILSPSSFTFSGSARPSGKTCCGRDERCSTPPCSTGSSCRREQR